MNTEIAQQLGEKAGRDAADLAGLLQHWLTHRKPRREQQEELASQAGG